MITITEKNNKIYILQDSRENKKSSGSGILLYWPQKVGQINLTY